MPITKQAIKKQLADQRRTSQNNLVRRRLSKLIKAARQKPSTKALEVAFQALDKAAKRHLVHPNKASRLKSRLAKLLRQK